MERLTNHFDYCDFTECRHYDKELANSDSCNFIHSSRERCLEYAVYNKLRQYEDLEEQGLLIKLPCKVGTPVYDIKWWDDKNEKVKVDGKIYYRTIRKYKVSKSTFTLYDFDQFGKTVFLTKKKLKKHCERRWMNERIKKVSVLWWGS